MRKPVTKKAKALFVIIVLFMSFVSAILSAAPSAAEAIAEGDRCYFRGDFMGALWHYTAAKDLDSAQAGSWEKMAWAASAAGKTDDALNFATESEKRGMDKPRLNRVRAWIYMKKADTDREAGNKESAKTNYQHAINFASSGVDQPLAQAAQTRLSELNSSSSSTTASESSEESEDSESSSSSSSSSSSTTSSATSELTEDFDSSSVGELKAPSKKEIESRIKQFASEKDLTTFTDANGRLQVKDSDGNVVPLGAEIFAPSGEMPTKEVIEARIKKWAATVGLTTGTDEKSGRLVAKDSNGNVVPLPPSIFYPVRSNASSTTDVASDTSTVDSDTESVASDTETVASSSAKIINSSDDSVSSPEDTLLNDD